METQIIYSEKNEKQAELETCNRQVPISRDKVENFTRVTISRSNILLEKILVFFYMASSHPRLLLEVFIRKEFGVRYYNFMSACTAALLALLIPLGLMHRDQHSNGTGIMLFHWASYIIFIYYFLAVSWKRHQEMKHVPGVLELKKHSKFSGHINPKFYEFEFFGVKTTKRIIETIYEPAVFMLLGIALIILQQRLGFLLAGCSIVYSLGYYAAYRISDHQIMNLIDKKLANDNFQKVFIDGEDSGIIPFFRGKAPSSADTRRSLFTVDSDDDFYEVK